MSKCGKLVSQRQRVCSTYHSLFATLLTISALDIIDKKVALGVPVQPDSLSGLLTTLGFVHDFKSSVKEQI